MRWGSLPVCATIFASMWFNSNLEKNGYQYFILIFNMFVLTWLIKLDLLPVWKTIFANMRFNSNLEIDGYQLFVLKS